MFIKLLLLLPKTIIKNKIELIIIQLKFNFICLFVSHIVIINAERQCQCQWQWHRPDKHHLIVWYHHHYYFFLIGLIIIVNFVYIYYYCYITTIMSTDDNDNNNWHIINSLKIKWNKIIIIYGNSLGQFLFIFFLMINFINYL